MATQSGKVPLLGFRLSPLMNLARARLQQNNSLSVEAVVDAILKERNLSINAISIGRPLTGDALDNEIFDAAVSNKPDMEALEISDKGVFSDRMETLTRAIQKMKNLKFIAFKGLRRMSKEEAETMFTVLEKGVTIEKLCIVWRGRNTEDVVDVVARYIKTSPSLVSVKMDFSRMKIGTRLSGGMFSWICCSIRESTSLRRFCLVDTPVDVQDSDKAIKCLASTLIESSVSLLEIWKTPVSFTASLVCRELLQSPQVRDSNLSFRKSSDPYNDVTEIRLIRDCWWRSALPLDINPSLWPLILAKADSWHKESSHSSIDILHFLMKEKCDVLCQNAR